MAKSASKKEYKVGDKVEAYLMDSSWKKKKINGTIKEVRDGFGKKTYVVTGGVVEDFPTRNVK